MLIKRVLSEFYSTQILQVETHDEIGMPRVISVRMSFVWFLA